MYQHRCPPGATCWGELDGMQILYDFFLLDLGYNLLLMAVFKSSVRLSRFDRFDMRLQVRDEGLDGDGLLVAQLLVEPMMKYLC